MWPYGQVNEQCFFFTHGHSVSFMSVREVVSSRCTDLFLLRVIPTPPRITVLVETEVDPYENYDPFYCCILYWHKQGVPISQNVTHASDIVSTPSTPNRMLRMNVGDTGMQRVKLACCTATAHRLTFGGILRKRGGRICNAASVQRVGIRAKKRLILFLRCKPRIRA